MDEDAVPPPGASAGFVSGNETSFNFTDDDVIHSDVGISGPAAGSKIFLTIMGD